MAWLSLKRAIVAGGAAAVLAGVAIGVAAAQQTPTPIATATRAAGASGAPRAGAPGARADQFLEALFKRLGVTTEKLKQAIQDARKDAGVPDRGHLGPPFGFHHGPGPRSQGVQPGQPGRPAPFGPGRGAPGFGPLMEGLQAAANTIGITTDQLRQELPGKSLSDVAKTHNADPKKVADALKAEAKSRIDQAVANGRVPADRAAQLKQGVDQMVDRFMDQKLPERPAPGTPGPRGAQPQGPGTPAPPRA